MHVQHGLRHCEFERGNGTLAISMLKAGGSWEIAEIRYNSFILLKSLKSKNVPKPRSVVGCQDHPQRPGPGGLRPFPAEKMEAFPVGDLVNSVRKDGPELIQAHESSD